MTTKRRQSSSYSDELSRYEFVDYTSVSNFEKFVTTIEETLFSWGIKDGSYGIFSNEQLKNHGAAISHPSALEFTRRETLVMGEDAFELTYHHHPLEGQPERKESFPLAADQFYYFGYQQYQPLHRWTGFDRILMMHPNNDSLKKKLFNPGGKSTVDIYQAKQIISACAIAFQNVGCKIPVFVPVGQSRHEMYMGYMLNSNTHDALNETEVRFNMSLTTPPSSELSYLDGLKTLFVQKLRANREDYAKPGDDDFWVSAVYTYNLKNWFDENWKIWDEVVKPTLTNNTVKRKISFSDDFESWGDEDDDDVDAQMGKQDNVLQEPQHHQLQFGSFNDPLRTLTLSALFPLSQDALFDDAYQTNMDALTAKQWQISREFAPKHQQRAYLSTLLEQAIASWVKDPSNRDYLAPYDDSNDDSTSDSISLMRNLFAPGGNNLNQVNMAGDQQVNFFKSDQVDNVMIALFHSKPYVPKKEDTKSTDYLTTKELGLRLKTGSAVPYRSFLWNLLLYSLEEVSSTSDYGKKQNASNFLGFFKIIWLEVLRKLRWHWENLVPIPDLNPYLYDSSNSDANFSKTLGIDLRYNILHQKISMVNCCILRKLQNSPQNGNTADYDIKPAKHVSTLFDNVSTDRQQSRSSKFQNMLEQFVDGTISESAIEDSVSFVASDIEDADSENSDIFLDAVEEGSTSSEEKEESLLPNNTTPEPFVSLPYIPATNSADELEAEAATIKDPKIAEGQSHTHEHLKLLKTGEPMQIPITQDPGFMTEDMINEQADVFESLGTSVVATHQRAKLQSAQLYSDMQAFKAANPFACLEDFVRWHSPRDWIVDENCEGGGRLSTRMSEPTNIWQELWKCSRRIPCQRQKPLFNVSVEAEKGLYYLETTSIYELFSIMLPTLGLIAYDTLSTHAIAKYSKHVANGLSRLCTDLTEFPWDDFRHGKRTFDSVINTIRQQESMMCHAISLLRKLPGQYDLVDQLLFHDQTIVKEGEERSTVFQLFKNEHGTISKPSYREYILYSDCKDLTTEGRVLPQRQYAIVKDNEIRILDMHTIDALYC